MVKRQEEGADMARHLSHARLHSCQHHRAVDSQYRREILCHDVDAWVVL